MLSKFIKLSIKPINVSCINLIHYFTKKEESRGEKETWEGEKGWELSD